MQCSVSWANENIGVHETAFTPIYWSYTWILWNEEKYVWTSYTGLNHEIKREALIAEDPSRLKILIENNEGELCRAIEG